MKLQCGVIHFEHRSATPEDLARLLGNTPRRTSDFSGLVKDDALLMVYRGDRITAEEDSEVQPLRHGDCVLTWDGRLDNRQELAGKVGLNNIAARSDPEVVLTAFRMLGEHVFTELVGEFALALWCARTESLTFARSTCGARTLYYTLEQSTLTWSSSFAHLVKISHVDLVVNDTYVLEYLVTQPPADSSPLNAVHVVPPNRAIRFERSRLVSSRELWSPTHVPALNYRHDHEYEEHFRHEIAQAVRVRLRAKQPVFAELSGGLDSSSIVVTADQLMREGNAPLQHVQTTSCVYQDSETCDEQAFIRAVEGQRGIKSLLVTEREQQITLGLSAPVFTGLPNALHCFPGRYQRVAQLMQEHRARVLLTGRGGDHLFWSEANGSALVADHLCNGKLFRAHSESRMWGHAATFRYCDLLKSAFPLVLDSFFPKRSLATPLKPPNWIQPQHRERICATVPVFDGFAEWNAQPTKRFQILVLEHMYRYLGSGFFHEFDELYVSHPYTHRPLVEFCLGTPVSQFLREGETRSLMRRALSDQLPAKICKRKGKGLLDEAVARALQREWEHISRLRNWALCERGYVSPTQLLETLDHARLGLIDATGPLIRVFSMERWLRTLTRAHAERGHTNPMTLAEKTLALT